jgi:hypothetical protein
MALAADAKALMKSTLEARSAFSAFGLTPALKALAYEPFGQAV